MISSSVRQRLAPGPKLPYSICGSHGAGLSQTMTWKLFKRSNFARIQTKRVSTKQRVAGSGDAASHASTDPVESASPCGSSSGTGRSRPRVASWSTSCPCRPCPCPSPLLQLAGKAPELSRDSYGGQSAASHNPYCCYCCYSPCRGMRADITLGSAGVSARPSRTREDGRSPN